MGNSVNHPPETDDDLRAANNIGPLEELLAIGDSLVGCAEPGEAIEVALARGSSTTVKVHSAEVESLTSAGSAGAGIRVIRDGRVGFASSGSHDSDVLAETLAEARDNCRFAEPDDHNGLAEPDGVEIVHHDLWQDAVIALDTPRRIAIALELERLVLGADDRVSAARTTTYADGWGQSALVSTAGARVSSEETEATVATQPLARSGSETQIGWGFETGRDPEALDLERVAREAIERATKLLGRQRPCQREDGDPVGATPVGDTARHGGGNALGRRRGQGSNTVRRPAGRSHRLAVWSAWWTTRHARSRWVSRSSTARAWHAGRTLLSLMACWRSSSTIRPAHVGPGSNPPARRCDRFVGFPRRGPSCW